MIAEAARVYPPPEDAQTRQVAAFIRLLRADAEPARLQAAADAIRVDGAAREDVNRHRVELALAYRKCLDGENAQIVQDKDQGFTR